MCKDFIFQYLPIELIYKIINDYDLFVTPSAKIMKKFLNENKIWKNEIIKEINFYQYCKLIKVLNEIEEEYLVYENIELIYILNYIIDAEENG